MFLTVKKGTNCMFFKSINNILLFLISILPISILVGSAVSLSNIIIFDFLFIYLLFLKKDFN